MTYIIIEMTNDYNIDDIRGVLPTPECPEEDPRDIIEFEEPNRYERNTPPSLRYKKFLEVVLSADLPWYLRENLLQYFPRFERYFLETDRTNFINLPQLCREALILMGEEEYADRFTPLKTKSRCRQVAVFVKDCFNFFEGSGATNLVRLENLPMKAMIGSNDIDFSKVYDRDHIYSDKGSTNYVVNNIYAYQSKKAKAPSKAKAKTPSKAKG